MELQNNNKTENIEDIDFELLGRKMKLPNCSTCIYSDGSICKKYGVEKSELSKKGIDIFNCPSYQKKEEPRDIEKVKELGFGI